MDKILIPVIVAAIIGAIAWLARSLFLVRPKLEVPYRHRDGQSSLGPAGTMQIEQVFEQFAAMLKARLDAKVFTTEDSVRYTFYAAAASFGGVRDTEIVLEYPHPTIPNARIDTILLSNPDRVSMALEFKYDRANPGGSNQNRTQRAASALVDVFRLARVPSNVAAQRYFVYVTDAEMAGYFKNPANRLDGFFDLCESATMALGLPAFAGLSQTFRSRVDPHVCECRVRGVYATELSDNLSVRAFEVLAA